MLVSGRTAHASAGSARLVRRRQLQRGLDGLKAFPLRGVRYLVVTRRAAGQSRAALARAVSERSGTAPSDVDPPIRRPASETTATARDRGRTAAAGAPPAAGAAAAAG